MLKPTGVERYIYNQGLKRIADIEHKSSIGILTDREYSEVKELYDSMHAYWVKYKAYLVGSNPHSSFISHL